MAHLFSHLNPVPSFPPYTGPYAVGTVDVEIPVANLPSPSPAPDPKLSTVHFRIFYPCEEPQKHPKRTYWIPDPQREYLGAYARFLGAGPSVAELFSCVERAHTSSHAIKANGTVVSRYLPRLLYHVTMPVFQGARLLPAPTKKKRWPVMVFSHGLGGSRNAYSHLLGSLSSHGVVVVAPDHRDGSAPMALIKSVKQRGKVERVEYRTVPHKPSPEVEEGRSQQLRIRLWELGLAHEAMLKIDRGDEVVNLSVSDQHPDDSLSMFRSTLGLHEPGSITWAGHSFGAATVVQFVKSVFWRPSQRQGPEPYLADYQPLYTPSTGSHTVHQITPKSPVTLLDLWTLPLRGKPMRWLWNKPLPSYTPNGPGGANLLTILSEAFFKWRGNLTQTKRVLCSDPSTEHPASLAKPGPHIFYPVSSAHLSQSDFGILFPRVTKMVFKADDPERTLRLNTRAILQVLRLNGIEVADTSRIDMEEEEHAVEKRPNGVQNGHVKGVVAKNDGSPAKQDWKILATDGSVHGWISLSVDDDSGTRGTNGVTDADAMPSEAVMQNEVMNIEEGEKERL